MNIGYARVSTTDQNLARQIQALNEVGVEKIYADKLSGKNFDRKEYQKMKDDLFAGDILYVKSIDRLGRNYEMITDEWRDITRNIGADIVVIDMPLLDTRDKDKGLTGKFISDIVLQILSYVAEKERENIKKRQAEGIRIAKEKGIHLGRPKQILPDNFIDIANEWFSRNIDLDSALKMTNLSKSTFYKYATGLCGKKPKHKREYKVKNKYKIVGAFVNNTNFFTSRKNIQKELHISSKTLNKHLKGNKTILDKLGLKVEIIEK